MEEQSSPNILVPAAIISSILLIVVIGAFLSAKDRTGTIVLPGGNTYLGPTPTAIPVPPVSGDIIPVPKDVSWIERKGAVYPFTFSHPASLSLGVFPNDPYDAVTVFHPGTDANANIFIRVEDLTKLKKNQYIGKPKEYASDWWKDYSWKGVAEVSIFTNAAGLTGYRAKYLNDEGLTPYDHIFFAVPNKPNLIIWMSGRLFEPAVFSRMVDSVSWSTTP